ncbi:Gfo/Idh/MocA family oxidoreductase [Alicyclobacillus fastidiosus]|uniref:Gfo/Idh/MocA family oxidoreductase n=1 Tax=Alicyclobacillus fastidiosus TaxID=392011 RepID=A0ABY6ZGP6_9BACL|nr:Gfo/Idh/MocA family oxidoreductase [Alicyclobacillus fastidiosus]WAH41763.1 Gfo/Idh/MocA family oxidoreductase [Alicyclobacillus fastidiosus]GMA63455.1 dehydrogenase [Alicyclobacillus fastidiosus]
MIRVAMLSFWHVHAKDYARQATEHPDTEIVAVWDEIPERGKQEAERLSVPFYASLEELLARDDIDAVIVDTPTNIHPEVMIQAARAKKHIFTEKVLALTTKEATSILSHVEQAGVKLTVSLPRLNDNYTLAIQDIIAQGVLGELTQVRVRLAHNGATAAWLPDHFYDLQECGGGALTDLGCHPMYLTRLFLGLPDSVSAHYGYVTGKEVEDNAVAILRYDNGAIGIVESGFVTGSSPFSIELHGTNGSALYGLPEPKLMVRTPASGSKEWEEYPLSPNRRSAFEQWVSHIQENTTADENIAMALDLTRLIEASNLSVQNNHPVQLDELPI